MLFRVLVVFVIILYTVSASSQDIIFKSDGASVDAKILSIGLVTIEFRKSNYPDGPVYIVSKTDIDSIKYTNGLVDIFLNNKSASIKLDTIIYNNRDTTIVDTVIIKGIKFYLSHSYTSRHDLLVDFSRYLEGSVWLKPGDVSFLFVLKNKNFTMRTSVSVNIVTIPFRLGSSGSLNRFKKLAYKRLTKIKFVSSGLQIDITENQSQAFNRMFEVYYLAY